MRSKTIGNHGRKGSRTAHLRLSYHREDADLLISTVSGHEDIGRRNRCSKDVDKSSTQISLDTADRYNRHLLVDGVRREGA